MIKQISITWTDEDVLQRAEEMGVSLTREEISDVLSVMEADHDATIGINWDVISYHIERVKEDK